MGLALYLKVLKQPSKVRHLNMDLKAPNQSLQLENTKSISKKLI